VELRAEQIQASIVQEYNTKITLPDQTSMKSTVETTTASSEHLKTDQVSISESAREKSINDKNQEAMRKILGKEGVTVSDTEEPKTLDEKIAELKEKIAELTAKLAQERRNGDEEKTKVMEVELAVLNSQLLQLVEQKMA
jgi:hypothetical protein